MDKSDRTVDKNTQEAANFSSPLYLEASMAVVVPAGIPDNTTATEVTSLSRWRSQHSRSTMAGMAISLMKL